MYKLALAKAPLFNFGSKTFLPFKLYVSPQISYLINFPLFPNGMFPLCPFTEESDANIACISLPVPDLEPL